MHHIKKELTFSKYYYEFNDHIFWKDVEYRWTVRSENEKQ